MIKKMITRSGVIIFWIALIFGALYWPEGLFSTKARSINVFVWGDILDPAVVAEFEKETGIKVNMNFYASNEEMLVKLRATKGHGYDMIIPSDYNVEILIKDGLIKELDKSRLHFYSHLNPKLLNLYFDPENKFSIPFEWEVFLIGIDKNYFADKSYNPSWKMLFDIDQIPYYITMMNDPIQMIHLTSFYLYGDIETVTPPQLQEITTLLTRQKKIVNAYADFRADYFLATQNSAAVVASSSYLWRTMKKFPFVGYVMPKEGSVITIENICIPKPSTKDDLTYRLINYLYSRASMKAHYESNSIFPATLDVIPDLTSDPETQQLLTLEKKEFETMRFTKLITSQDKIRDAWVQVKTN